MDLDMFIQKLLDESRQYNTLNGVEVLDKNGNLITDVEFDIDKNNRIILKTGGK